MRRWSTTTAPSPASSRSRSSPSSSPRRRRKPTSTARWSGPARPTARPRSGPMNSALIGMPLAAVGEVGEGFLKERTGETLPCQARPSHLFCWDWASENIHRYGTPALQQFELVIISVLIGFFVAFAFALLAYRFRWLQWPFLAGTGVIFA